LLVAFLAVTIELSAASFAGYLSYHNPNAIGGNFMEISTKAVESSPQVNIVSFNGALNARSAEEAKQVFRDLVEQGIKQVIVDLQEVPFIDSSGLAALVSGLKTLGGESANLKLATPQSQARLLFELTMFDRVFEIHDSVNDALHSLKG